MRSMKKKLIPTERRRACAAVAVASTAVVLALVSFSAACDWTQQDLANHLREYHSTATTTTPPRLRNCGVIGGHLVEVPLGQPCPQDHRNFYNPPPTTSTTTSPPPTTTTTTLPPPTTTTTTLPPPTTTTTTSPPPTTASPTWPPPSSTPPSTVPDEEGTPPTPPTLPFL